MKPGFILWILLAGLLFSACQASDPTLAEAVVEASQSPTWTASSTAEFSFDDSQTECVNDFRQLVSEFIVDQ